MDYRLHISKNSCGSIREAASEKCIYFRISGCVSGIDRGAVSAYTTGASTRAAWGRNWAPKICLQKRATRAKQQGVQRERRQVVITYPPRLVFGGLLGAFASAVGLRNGGRVVALTGSPALRLWNQP